MNSIYITVCTLFFNVLLLFGYFCKKRVKLPENTFYSGVTIMSFIGLLVEILGAWLVLKVHVSTDSIWYIFQVKAVYFVYLFWVTFISLYFLVLILNHKKKKIYNAQFLLVVMSILNIIAVLLPINTMYIKGMLTPTGPCIYVSNILANTYIVIMLVIVLINHKVIKMRERIPLIFTAILFFTNIYLQFYQQLFLTHSFTTFISFIMYFTIQNPDIKMLEQVEISKNIADKANQAKSDFLSSMSHEIRTPLNAIVGFSEELKEDNLSETQKENVDDIISASQTLLETVNGILDISKIEANKIEIISTEYNFDEVFNDLVALSKARLGDDKPIIFEYTKDKSIPTYLYGDHIRVKQVILNLLTNAIKYTNEGSIKFNVSSINTKDTCFLTIKVSDTGMGIKDESLKKLFNKFERLDNENSGIEGTGLGLAITKKLVTLMGGRIEVESTYGKGSTFTIILSQKIVTNPTIVIDTNNKENTIEHNLSNKKVLIVDDNKLNLKVTKNLLEKYNIVTEEILSGIECLDLINKGNKYDLILLDDMMPEKSGKETFKELKSIPSFNIPVVILTANAIEGMKEEYLALGFDDYLAKPIDKYDLNNIIKKYLDK